MNAISKARISQTDRTTDATALEARLDTVETALWLLQRSVDGLQSRKFSGDLGSYCEDPADVDDPDVVGRGAAGIKLIDVDGSAPGNQPIDIPINTILPVTYKIAPARKKAIEVVLTATMRRGTIGILDDNGKPQSVVKRKTDAATDEVTFEIFGSPMGRADLEAAVPSVSGIRNLVTKFNVLP